jgi:hypothetical protein
MAEFSAEEVSGCYRLSRSSIHGIGVCATQNVPNGERVLKEKPLLRLQSLPNRSDALVCGQCFRFVGTVGIQLRFLARVIDRRSSFDPAEVRLEPDVRLSEIVKCGFDCGEIYCSEQCR